MLGDTVTRPVESLLRCVGALDSEKQEVEGFMSTFSLLIPIRSLLDVLPSSELSSILLSRVLEALSNVLTRPDVEDVLIAVKGLPLLLLVDRWAAEVLFTT